MKAKEKKRLAKSIWNLETYNAISDDERYAEIAKIFEQLAEDTESLNDIMYLLEQQHSNI